MGSPALLDLHYFGTPRVIGVYLVETDDGLALFDCGPTSSTDALRARLFAAPRNLVRLPVGLESANDLIADLEAALVRR